MSWIERARPDARKHVIVLIARLVPHCLSVALEEVLVHRTPGCLLELVQIASEDALELVAIAAEIGFVWIVQDTILVDHCADCAVGDALCVKEELAVVRCFAEFNQASENDTLVVGPHFLFVVLAGFDIEAVVYDVVLVDHAASLEPVPLACGPVGVVGLVWHPVGKMGCNAEEKFVGNGGVGLFLFVPPYATAGGVVACADHVIEDVVCCLQVLRGLGKVVHFDPGQRPPSFIVVEAIKKSFRISVFDLHTSHTLNVSFPLDVYVVEMLRIIVFKVPLLFSVTHRCSTAVGRSRLSKVELLSLDESVGPNLSRDDVHLTIKRSKFCKYGDAIRTIPPPSRLIQAC
jgi:hypothetical protein